MTQFDKADADRKKQDNEQKNNPRPGQPGQPGEQGKQGKQGQQNQPGQQGKQGQQNQPRQGKDPAQPGGNRPTSAEQHGRNEDDGMEKPNESSKHGAGRSQCDATPGQPKR